MALVVLAAIAVSTMLVLRFWPRPETSGEKSPPAVASRDATGASEPSETRPPVEAGGRALAPAVVGPSSSSDPSDPSTQRARIAKLDALAREEDPESLQSILAALEDPDPVIRKAALQATRSYGSRDAVPRLRELAAASDDLDEQAALLDAVKFLEMPTLTEVRQWKREGKLRPPER